MMPLWLALLLCCKMGDGEGHFVLYVLHVAFFFREKKKSRTYTISIHIFFFCVDCFSLFFTCFFLPFFFHETNKKK